MPYSLFAKIRLRLVDHLLDLAQRPNRIDTAARISPLANVTASSIHGPVEVADHVRLHRVQLSGPVSVGRNSSVWGPTYVLAQGAPVTVGSFCSIARDVHVHGYGHDYRRLSTHFIGRNVLGHSTEDEIVGEPIAIGHDVWVGAGVHVLSGVSIGTGAVIGAGSVVARDIPPYAVAVGAPAVPVRSRFDEEIIQRLLASKWWTWTLEEIRSKEPLFTQPVTRELLDEFL